MNNTVKKLLLNLYFIKQLISQSKFSNAKELLENETGLDIEELINNHNDKNLEEATSIFAMELATLKDESFDQISVSFTQFLSLIYYSIIDLENDFVQKDEVIDSLNILFRFPAFEATLLHYVQNELIKDLDKFNNVVLSTYIHVCHIKYLSIIDDIDALNQYIYDIGIDTYIGDVIDLGETEVDLIKSLEIENDNYSDSIKNYFNSISNEIVVSNVSEVITSCEFVQEQLRKNIYIKNIV